MLLGRLVGVLVGMLVGVLVGKLVGVLVGMLVGRLVNVLVGRLVNVLVGMLVNVLVGVPVTAGSWVWVDVAIATPLINSWGALPVVSREARLIFVVSVVVNTRL